MISLDELSATIKRQELLMNNSSSPEEQFIAMNISNNLKGMLNQLTMLVTRPDFKDMVAEFTKAREEEEKND